MTGTMMIHTPGGQKVGLDYLKALPDPVKMGRWHKPRRHDEVIEQVLAEMDLRGIPVTGMELATAAHDARLFALFHLNGEANGRQASMALRASTDQSLNLKGVAGSRVFICDNLSLSGQEFLFERKQTIAMYLVGVIRVGLDRYLKQAEGLELRIKQLEAAPISVSEAKERIYDAFLDARVAAPRYLPKVHEAYFGHGEQAGAGWDYPEVTRTEWGVHNAFTRVFRDVESTVVKQEATQKLGRFFRM